MHTIVHSPALVIAVVLCAVSPTATVRADPDAPPQTAAPRDAPRIPPSRQNGEIQVVEIADALDGTDASSIQAALDAKAEAGGVVQLEADTYRIDMPLRVPEGVTLAGVWEAPHHAELGRGTVLEIVTGAGKEDGPAAVRLSPSSCVKGVTFFYPEQRIPDTIPYPWTIQGRGMHPSVIDCTFVNAYKAIDFGTYHHELHYIANCYGCPLKIGVSIDRCTDIGRIENVHFNPHYWERAGAPDTPPIDRLIEYLGDNLVAFQFGRTDWQSVRDTFSFGAKIGYRFYRSKAGMTNGSFVGIGADWARRALVVENCQLPGLLITNGQFVGRKGTDAMIEIEATNTGVVNLNNCSFWGPCPTVAIVDGPGPVSFNQCTFENYPPPDATPPNDWFTIDVRGRNATLIGCRFGRNHPDIRLGPAVETAIIMGNRFVEPIRIDNESNGVVEQGMNVAVKAPPHAQRR